jgi:hypothetical protein
MEVDAMTTALVRTLTTEAWSSLAALSLNPWMGCWSQSACEIKKMPFDLG